MPNDRKAAITERLYKDKQLKKGSAQENPTSAANTGTASETLRQALLIGRNGKSTEDARARS